MNCIPSTRQMIEVFPIEIYFRKDCLVEVLTSFFNLFSADPIPIPCESKGDGESGQAALYFYREQSCREGTYIAALSLYRAK